MGAFRVGKDGILEKLRKEELGRIESGYDIYKRLDRSVVGEAILSDDLIKTFESLLMEGNTRTNAAKVVGLTRRTLSNWITKGQKDIEKETDTLYSRLVLTIDRCEGEQERQLVLSAMRAAMSPASDGTLALKILERRNPDHWAPALADTSNVPVQFADMGAQALQQEARRILTAAASKTSSEVTVVPEPEKK